MKKQVLISLMLFFAALSTMLTLPGSANAQIYARLELENIDQDTGPNWDNEEADVFIRLYSDMACTIPYIASADLEVKLRCDYAWSDIYQTGSDYYVSWSVVPSGESEVFHGRMVLDGNDYWGGYWPGSPHIWTNTILTYETSPGTGYYTAATVFN